MCHWETRETSEWIQIWIGISERHYWKTTWHVSLTSQKHESSRIGRGEAPSVDELSQFAIIQADEREFDRRVVTQRKQVYYQWRKISITVISQETETSQVACQSIKT